MIEADAFPRNPDAIERERLRALLGPDIKPKTIQIWFQNRRSKSRAKERGLALRLGASGVGAGSGAASGVAGTGSGTGIGIGTSITPGLDGMRMSAIGIRHEDADGDEELDSPVTPLVVLGGESGMGNSTSIHPRCRKHQSDIFISTPYIQRAVYKRDVGREMSECPLT